MTRTPGNSHARFEGYDVLDHAPHWDQVTQGVVLRRLRPPQRSAFFGTDEEPTARCLVDRILAQDEEPRVPVFEMIDERLAQKQGDGFRYDNMPDDDVAWRRSIANLDADAHFRFGRPFWDVAQDEQMSIIDEVRDGNDMWFEMPAKRVFSLWMRYCCDAFYSHPWAWNEIGFGGPAYPRGYKNLGIDRREPWEVPEYDASDPIPWAKRAEAARKRHEAGLISTPPVDEGDRSK